MRVIQNPTPKNIRRVRYKRRSRVTVYDDRAEVEVFGDDQPHIIDPEYAEEVAKYRWQRNSAGYAQTWIDGHRGALHRFVFGTVPTGLEVDHIDRNRRNNRRVNLRLATHAENGRNKSRQCNNTSGVLGVCWSEERRKWVAQIQINGEKRHLGRFKNFDDAVAARKAAEVKLFGAFAPRDSV